MAHFGKIVAGLDESLITSNQDIFLVLIKTIVIMPMSEIGKKKVLDLILRKLIATSLFHQFQISIHANSTFLSDFMMDVTR